MRFLLFLLIIFSLISKTFANQCSELFFKKITTNSAISIVIPVYQELYNGNLHRLLDNLSTLNMNELPQNTRVQVVVIVNNLKSSNKEVKKENRLTVQVLQNTKIKYFPLEAAALRKIKMKGIKLLVIDRVTPGFKLRRIGFVRNLGFEKAQESASDISPSRHFIANLDADTSVPSNYLTKIHRTLSDMVNIEAMFLNRKLKIEPGSEEPLYISTHVLRFRDGKDRFFESLNLRTPEDGIVVGGPQIVIRASTLKTIGGIPKVDSGEDWILANILWKRGKVYRENNVVVRPGDRARPEGYDAKLRFDSIKKDTEVAQSNLELEDYPLENYLVDALDGMSFDQITNRKTIEPLFEFFTIPFNMKLWNKAIRETVDPLSSSGISWIKIDKALFKNYLLSVKPLLQENSKSNPNYFRLIEWIKSNVKQDEFRILQNLVERAKKEDERETKLIHKDLLSFIKNGELSHPNGERSKEFFEGNVWIADLIEKYRAQGKSNSEVYNRVIERYPEWFNKFNLSTFRREEVVFFELTRWVYGVRFTPKSYPSSINFFDKIDELIDSEKM